MNIGIDFHDTLTYAPEFFYKLIWDWHTHDGYVYIVTGTPPSQKQKVEDTLRDMGVLYACRDILMGYEYEKSNMTIEHFHRMRDHKLKLLQDHDISVYFDDNPFYAHWMKEHGITVMMPCINPTYLEQFSKTDPFFTCHLQEKMFNFLEELTNNEVCKKP